MINYEGLFQAIIRIEVTFGDGIGNFKSGIGTGFAFRHNNKIAIVTNRHMVDYKFGRADSKFTLSELFLWCRTLDKPSIENAPRKFGVNIAGTKLIHHPTADLSIIIHPVFHPSVGSPTVNPVDNMNASLASKEFFDKELGVFDPCSFIGYPSQNGKYPWWDTELGLPIVRMANIASKPSIQFTNENIKSSHARLVSGLSFSGSSGSPILNIGSQIKTKTGYLNVPDGIEPRIIGIMAGHFDHDELPSMIKHTGLSYFVSSEAIFELLSQI